MVDGDGNPVLSQEAPCRPRRASSSSSRRCRPSHRRSTSSCTTSATRPSPEVTGAHPPGGQAHRRGRRAPRRAEPPPRRRASPRPPPSWPGRKAGARLLHGRAAPDGATTRTRGAPTPPGAVHYLLEPGWRADQAIQGLGRTHRTHQASAPLFRPRPPPTVPRRAALHQHHRPKARLPGRHHPAASARRKPGGCSGPRTTSRASTPGRRFASSTSPLPGAASRAGPSNDSRAPPDSRS